MTLEQFANRVEGFTALGHTAKIQHFAWYLHVHGKQSHFDAAAIRACFDELHMAAPSSIHPFLRSLAEQKPKKLIRDAKGYRLEKEVRDDLDSKYGTRPAFTFASGLLESVAQKVSAAPQKGYLEETIKCFQCGAHRAAIVMAWN
jgi:hypothetical protein